MANQTVTTGTPAAPINYDDPTILALANGETLTINGAMGTRGLDMLTAYLERQLKGAGK